MIISRLYSGRPIGVGEWRTFRAKENPACGQFVAVLAGSLWHPPLNRQKNTWVHPLRKIGLRARCVWSTLFPFSRRTPPLRKPASWPEAAEFIEQERGSEKGSGFRAVRGIAEG